MPHRNPDNRDVSRACWRCEHFGAIVEVVHASCSRDGGCLMAAPHRGCVFWVPGPGHARTADWLPPGFAFTERVTIWGAPPSPFPPEPTQSTRPGVPAEAAAWDRQQEQQAWRAVDALLGQFRPARSEPHTQPNMGFGAPVRKPRDGGADDQPVALLA